MTNYTDGQIVSEIEKCEASGLVVVPSMLRSLLAERQAAKAGVVSDDAVRRAEAVRKETHKSLVGRGSDYTKHTRNEIAMRAALASVWPTAGGDGRDAERFRYCLQRGFPVKQFPSGWCLGSFLKHETASEAIDYAMAHYPIAAAEGEKK